jgi:hypothetical protein
MAQQHRGGAETTARMIRSFLASYDARDASDRQIAYRIRERVHSELYRRVREQYPAWIDLGGEGGEG